MYLLLVLIFTEMKINEKHLIALVNGDAPIDKEGFLQKRGEVNRAFQKRWFVLKGNILFYFDKKGDREPNGVIILEGVTLEITSDENAFTFDLVFPGSTSRTYTLAAESQDEMEAWMKAIVCASYDYMKSLVCDLQRQMDDLAAAERTRTESNIRTRQQTAVTQLTRIAPPPPPNSQPIRAAPMPPSSQARLNPFNSVEPDRNLVGACAEAVLIDVSDYPPIPPPRKTDTLSNLDTNIPPTLSRANKDVDPFYDSAFASAHISSGSGGKHSEFIRMHEEFGRYICEMMRQHFPP